MMKDQAKIDRQSFTALECGRLLPLIPEPACWLRRCFALVPCQSYNSIVHLYPLIISGIRDTPSTHHSPQDKTTGHINYAFVGIPAYLAGNDVDCFC